jgi:tetratricopeptide (TPR) repeat protein
LDQEQFALAISKFKKVLNISPVHEDALIGMAESYKVQGSNNSALDYYRAYLRAHPAGSRAVLARRNVKELEQKTGVAPEPSPEPVPSPTETPENSPPPSPQPEPAESSPAPTAPSDVTE